MELLKEYNDRHSAIKIKLQELSASKIKSGKAVIVCKVVGGELGLSGQTVYNYINGKINDGYLAEVIYKALKKYKSK